MRYFGCALLAVVGIVYLVFAWVVLAGLTFTFDAPGSAQLNMWEWMLVVATFVCAPVALGLTAWWLMRQVSND